LGYCRVDLCILQTKPNNTGPIGIAPHDLAAGELRRFHRFHHLSDHATHSFLTDWFPESFPAILDHFLQMLMLAMDDRGHTASSIFFSPSFSIMIGI
jgi:hypothetical protein